MRCETCLRLIEETQKEGKKCSYCKEQTWIKLEDLKPNTKNPRHMTKPEMNKLIRNIRENGFLDPLIVNQNPDRLNIIIGGHQRWNAARRIGMKQVPVVYVSVTEEKEHMLNISLNSISGDWDNQKLFDLINELNQKDVDLTLTGFDEPFLDEIMGANEYKEKEAMIDNVPSEPINPKSQRGERYRCGRHIVMCGDSTSEEDFDKLMNGIIGDAVWTDPPYGVSYKGTNNPNGKDWGVMDNDALRGDDLYQFLSKIFKNLSKHTKKNPSLYCCYASINHIIFERAMNEAGFIVKQQLIWEKGHVLGHSDYHWSHEPILYCRKVADNNEWLGDRTQKTFIQNATVEQMDKLTKEQLIEMMQKIQEQSNVIKVSKDPTQEYVHSTQKPVELIRRLIKNTTRPQEVIIEPCAGSGSVMIACETTKRASYNMEISEKYVDVAIIRWQKLTGEKAVRLLDGKYFDDL